MGWLFGKKKKVPKVPLPEGRELKEGMLQFPDAPPEGKVIQPDQVKAAVGFDTPISAPEPEPSAPLPPEAAAPMPEAEEVPSPAPVEEPVEYEPAPPMTRPPADDLLYVKVNVYQRILGELDDLKGDFTRLHDAQRELEDSEYNEEKHFEKLKKTIRTLHDSFLQIDKELFKTQGD